MFTEEQNKAINTLATLCVSTKDDNVLVNDVLAAVRQRMAENALVKTRGCQSHAANLIGINRGTLRSMLRKMGYKKQGSRHGS